MDVRVNGLTVAAAVLLWLAPAQAQGPAFDCAKAQGEVEQLICRDQALAALDRKLDGVYKAASAKARETLSTLRAEQRGWVSGRNECWKAKNADNAVYLTASWTASSVRECVEAQYRLRTAELQALYQLVTPKTVYFVCQNNPANEIVATFFQTDPPTARVERGDRTVTVYLVPAASGAKYEGQNVEFWSKGQEASVSWMNPATGETEKLQCKVRP
jgi:uncharacterized protein